nr:hypothetical protein [Tanacetum cinerariifolium]
MKMEILLESTSNKLMVGNFKKRKWRYLILADSQIYNHMLIPDYQDIIFQDFHYFDEFKCYQVIKIGRIIDTTSAQQKVLDDELFAPANRLMIEKCNVRLSSNLSSKEPTLKVVFDALKLTSFYKAFEITADVP